VKRDWRPCSSSRIRSVSTSIRSCSSSEPERTNLDPFPVVRQPSGQIAAVGNRVFV
jgi:hypothetical protein